MMVPLIIPPAPCYSKRYLTSTQFFPIKKKVNVIIYPLSFFFFFLSELIIYNSEALVQIKQYVKLLIGFFYSLAVGYSYSHLER